MRARGTVEVRWSLVPAFLLTVAVLAAVAFPAAATDEVAPDKQKRPDPDLADSAYPPQMPGARVETYKTIGDVELRLYLFVPDGHAPGARRPAIVFFFGGGWRSGNPRQFEQQCRYLAARGMVAVAADYRVTTRHDSRGVDSVRDANSAVRWLRANADRLGIDPQRIAAGGGSAGGHLAATTGVAPGLDEATEDPDISSVPNALVLFNPFLVALKVEGSGLDYPGDITHSAGIEPIKISPYHHVRAGLPPTIIFHGRADKTVPYRTVEMYAEKAREVGSRCELVGYDDADHGFFNYGRGDGREFVDTVHRMDRFLTSLGWLSGEPTPLDPQDFSREAARRRFGSVPLRVNIAPGTHPPAGWVVTTGIPFREGGLTVRDSWRIGRPVGLRLCAGVEDPVDDRLGFVIDAVGVVVAAALGVPFPYPVVRQEDAGHVPFQIQERHASKPAAGSDRSRLTRFRIEVFQPATDAVGRFSERRVDDVEDVVGVPKDGKGATLIRQHGCHGLL